MNGSGSTVVPLNSMSNETLPKEQETTPNYFKNAFEVQPYEWEHEDVDNRDHLQIRIWALDRFDVPYLLRVENFPAFSYVELPHYVKRQLCRWDAKKAELVHMSISRRLKDDDCPLPYRASNFSYSNPLYYHRSKAPMLLVAFKRRASLFALSNLLQKPLVVDMLGLEITMKLSAWETEIDPIRKLLTKMDISHTSWVTCEARRVTEDEKISTLKEEYIIKWDTLTRLPAEKTVGWCTCPGILSFDIETYSDNHKMFPEKWNLKHVAYMISCTYQRVASKRRYRYGIIIGDCLDIAPEKFADTTLFKVDTEEELIRMFAAIVIHHDPEVITGYNILGFDFTYLDARLSLHSRDWPQMSRLLRRPTVMRRPLDWNSSGGGINSFHILDMPGRISIDMFPVVKRDYKLDFYDLNTVANFFVGKSKHDVKPEQMFLAYEKLREGLKYPGGDERHERALAEITDVMLYCIQDSELVLDIIDKVHLWAAALEFSAILGVTIFNLYTHGQQQCCVSQLYDLAVRRGVIMTRREEPDIPFAGGYVREPIAGIHDNVLCLDFKSLYPSIMQAYNICYTTLVPPEKNDQIDDSLCNIIEIDCDELVDPDHDPESEEEPAQSKGRKGKRVFKFLKQPIGLLPALVKNLVDERNKVRGQMKKEKDPVILTVLDKRQLALKISANSFFGFLGVRKGGKRALIEGAMSITAWGRKLINETNQYLIEHYGATIVYGDTDSSMFVIPDHIRDSKDCHQWGMRLAKETSDQFPDPLQMEFEKANRMLLLKKKKYAGLFINKDGSFERDKKGDLVLLFKGVIIARRDNCKWVRAFYRQLLLMTLTGTSFLEVVRFCHDQILNLISGRVPLEELIVIKTLGHNYASDSNTMKVFSEKLRRIGRPAQAGERLKYVVGIDEDAKLLGERMLLPEMYYDSLHGDKPERIDYHYYLDKILRSHVDQVISIVYRDDISQISDIYVKQSNRHKAYNAEDLIKMFSCLYVTGRDLIAVPEMVENPDAVREGRSARDVFIVAT